MSQIYYADSSVLVKRHIHEVGTDWLLELLDPSANNSITTSTLSIVEALSALNRRVREATIDIADYPKIAEDFLALSNNEYRFVNVTTEVIEKNATPSRILSASCGRCDTACVRHHFKNNNSECRSNRSDFLSVRQQTPRRRNRRRVYD